MYLDLFTKSLEMTSSRNPETNMTFFIGNVDPHTEDTRRKLVEIGKRGGQFYEYSPHMVLNTLVRNSNQDLADVYIPVTTPDEAAAALRIQAEVFGFDYDEIVETMGLPPSSSRLETYLLRAGGVPVCTAQLVRDENGACASLWNVATLLEYQRKGYATQLLQSVIDQAKKRGISHIHLMATLDGEPVYKRIGFTTIQRYGVFEIPGTYGRK